MTEALQSERRAQVTVAISTSDRSELLDRCIKGLLSGDVLPHDVVVIDQSRDDRTRQVVEQFGDGPVPIHYVRHDGRGLAISQNLAFNRAESPIIAVTDDDCVPARSWVATIDRLLGQAPSLDVLTGRVLPLGDEQPGLYAVSSRTGMQRVVLDHHAMPWEVGSGNNFAVRRDIVLRVGGNDERLGPGAPGRGGVDMDLFYRLLRAGARIMYEPDSLVYHERATRAGRLGRRVPYGYGMGACCSIWLVRGDGHALRVLARWLMMRLRRLLGGVRAANGLLVYEETLVLVGTVGGLIYGLRAEVPQRLAR